MGIKDICPDVIYEILTRTTCQLLMYASVYVSKGWQQQIHDPGFMQTYCMRTNSVFGFFIDCWHHLGGHIPEFVSMNEFSGLSIEYIGCMAILASSDQEILCCMRQQGNSHRYYVCKPTTQQWQPLSNSKIRYDICWIGMRVLGSNPLHYKIIRLSCRGSRG